MVIRTDPKTIIVLIIIGIGLYYGFAGTGSISECGAAPGNPGDVYYSYEVNGEYLVGDGIGDSGWYYQKVRDYRQIFGDGKTMIDSADSYYGSKRWNGNSGITYLKCTIGDYTPSRCSNPWSDCVGISEEELESFRNEGSNVPDSSTFTPDEPTNENLDECTDAVCNTDEDDTNTKTDYSQLNFFERLIQWLKNLFN